MSAAANSIHCLKLAPQCPHRVLAGHLWVYRSELQPSAEKIAEGAVVDVEDESGKYIGRGTFSTASQIAVRLLTRAPDSIGEDFFMRRIQQSASYRDFVCPHWPARRLVNSEGDFLPGLVVDQYGNVLVLQTLTQGMEKFKNTLVAVLQTLFKPAAIFEQNNSPARRLEQLPPLSGRLWGDAVDAWRVKLGAVDYQFSIAAGHKTGFYLDQQKNYGLVAGYVRPGMSVLDVFAYHGAFALHALLAGAEKAVIVENNLAALKSARDAAGRHNLLGRLQVENANAFDYLRQACQAKAQFDLIILDPPSFTRTRQNLKEARRGYKELHLRAFRLLKDGGLLVTFCCAHHVSATMFRDYILEAACDSRVALRREMVLTQAPDHPVLANVPETEYLKGFIFTVLKN